MPAVADPPTRPPTGGPPEQALPFGPDRTPDERAAWRCPTCNVDWPVVEAPDLLGLPEDYEFVLPRDIDRFECPDCENPIHFANNLNPIPVEEARRLKAHADFGRYYLATRGVEA